MTAVGGLGHALPYSSPISGRQPPRGCRVFIDLGDCLDQNRFLKRVPARGIQSCSAGF